MECGTMRDISQLINKEKASILCSQGVIGMLDFCTADLPMLSGLSRQSNRNYYKYHICAFNSFACVHFSPILGDCFAMSQTCYLLSCF